MMRFFLEYIFLRGKEDGLELWSLLCLWTCYLLPFLPAMPRIGNVEQADCIFVQAFGRGSWIDAVLGQILANVLIAAKGDDSSALNILRMRGFKPGESNFALARHAMRLHERYKIPIIAQWEVVCAIFILDPAWYWERQKEIDAIWPPTEGYFSTYHVKMASREKMLARGKCRPLEVSHPAMISRAVPTIWKLGVAPIAEGVSLFNFRSHELWVWDPNSVQPWTRGFRNWIPREAIGRGLHLVMHVTAGYPYRFAPNSIRGKIPGNWIRFTPPQTVAA